MRGWRMRRRRRWLGWFGGRRRRWRWWRWFWPRWRWRRRREWRRRRRERRHDVIVVNSSDSCRRVGSCCNLCAIVVIVHHANGATNASTNEGEPAYTECDVSHREHTATPISTAPSATACPPASSAALFAARRWVLLIAEVILVVLLVVVKVIVVIIIVVIVSVVIFDLREAAVCAPRWLSRAAAARHTLVARRSKVGDRLSRRRARTRYVEARLFTRLFTLTRRLLLTYQTPTSLSHSLHRVMGLLSPRPTLTRNYITIKHAHTYYYLRRAPSRAMSGSCVLI